MKNKLFLFGLLSFATLTSCSSDSSDEFVDANGIVAKKYITNITVVPQASWETTRNLTVTYNADGKVTKATNGLEQSTFNYEGGALKSVKGDRNDILSVTDMLQSPYAAYEYGKVLEYDSHANPIRVQIFKRDYDGSIYQEFVGEITYDEKPNPFFYTLEAAGIIDVLDDVNLNFSLVPQSEELIKAKMLLPVHNAKSVIIKTLSGELKRTVTANYVYDGEGYPTTGNFIDTTDRGTYTYTATYTYR